MEWAKRQIVETASKSWYTKAPKTIQTVAMNTSRLTEKDAANAFQYLSDAMIRQNDVYPKK